MDGLTLYYEGNQLPINHLLNNFIILISPYLVHVTSKTDELIQSHPGIAAPTDFNVMLQAIHATNIYELKVRNGIEALELLRLSRRIRGDLRRYVDKGGTKIHEGTNCY